MDVGEWLRGLGLGQYEAAFRDNKIDEGVLGDLTADDLKEIGVGPVWHRRKLLSALNLLFAEPGADARPIPAADGGPERRQLTVMFCDLVGSTALSARLDPEDMGDLIRLFRGAMTTAAARFDGHIAQFQGDGALIYFGYPSAHEDDASRAARAALEMIDTLRTSRWNSEAALQVRVGIATGLVVVGELIGQGESLARGVVGGTPNLAARLQAIAEPGCVVVSESTRRLLGQAFELQSLGPQTLKGFDAAVPAWTVTREIENISRFEASRSGVMTPFVGREREVSELLRLWREAANGNGQLALVSGEAGIGKSRVLVALRESLRREPHIVMRFQASPHHVSSAFYPMIGQLWHAAGFTPGEAAAERFAKLEALTARSGIASAPIMPFLASLLSMPFEGGGVLPSLSPSEIKEGIVNALMELFIGLNKQAPVLVLFEDMHWIDPSSIDLLNRVVEQAAGLRILLVGTHRPEFAPPWAGRPGVSTLPLNRFGRRQAAGMITAMLGRRALPPGALEQILEKTDGVPLFIEELVKNVLELGSPGGENGLNAPSTPLAPLAIPSTLRDSLMARLDRLGPVKEIAQIGAVIGREFSFRLLAAVAPVSEARLRGALRQLIDADLIRRRGVTREEGFIFKHALVQDAAYASLLRGAKQRIHSNIAQAMTERFAGEGFAPALAAYHFTEAGQSAPAAKYWLKAAERALSLSAPTEAERHAGAGLALISSLDAGPGRNALQLGLLTTRAHAVLTLKSTSSPESVAALSAAKDLMDTGVGSDLQRLSILYGLCSAKTLAARLSDALDLANEIIDLAEQGDQTIYKLIGYRARGAIQFYAGEHREALASLTTAGRHRDPNWHLSNSYRFAWDQGLAALCFESLTRLSMGQLDSAARIREHVRGVLKTHPHAASVASGTFCGVTWHALALGDIEACERDNVSLVAYCAEKKVEQIRLLAALHLAYARAARDPSGKKIDEFRAALDLQHKSGSLVGNTIHLSKFAELLLAANDPAGADAVLSEGFRFAEETGERYWLPDLHRIRGRVALASNQPDTALAGLCFRRAIDVAREQDARLLELRAANDLASLWRRTGSNPDYRAFLQPVLDGIEGGGDTPDVRAARALLAN